MDEKSSKEVLRKLGQHGFTLEDLAQLGDIHMCYAKDSTELEDPVGWHGWWPLEGIVSDERLADPFATRRVSLRIKPVDVPVPKTVP